MTQLNHHFKEESEAISTQETSMSPFFYFMVPFLILTTVNLVFLYVLSVDVQTILEIPFILSLSILLFVYILSKIIMSGNRNSRERAFIACSLHLIFIFLCIMSLMFGVFPIYIKILFAVWAYIRTIFFWNNIKPYFIVREKKKTS